ncbi:MAG: hypothetical protein GY784_15765 [Gammaproteobacteria bacterium]|nr:hypothetical protein [Gammaproteobacteria bacterium]
MFKWTSTCTITLALIYLVPLHLEARQQLKLDYMFSSELHENDSDEVLSSIIASLDSDYSSSRFSINADIESEFVYEHKKDEGGILWSGGLNSGYQIVNPLTWLLDVNLTEVNSPGTNTYDKLNSQTFTAATTGFEYVLIDSQVNGRLSLSLLANRFLYEESPLDAVENSLSLDYVYPIDSSSYLITSLSITSQEYDNETESVNDLDLEQWRIQYVKKLHRYTFSSFYEQYWVDYSNIVLSGDTDGYGMNVSYQFDVNSSLLLNASRKVEQSYRGNTDPIDPQNPILRPGLNESEGYSVRYNYLTDINIFSFDLYRDDIREVAQDETGNIRDGLRVNYSRVVNDRLNVGLNHHQFTNEEYASDYYLSSLIIDYQVSKSRRITSAVSLAFEEGEDDKVNIDDTVLRLEVTANIY